MRKKQEMFGKKIVEWISWIMSRQRNRSLAMESTIYTVPDLTRSCRRSCSRVGFLPHRKAFLPCHWEKLPFCVGETQPWNMISNNWGEMAESGEIWKVTPRYVYFNKMQTRVHLYWDTINFTFFSSHHHRCKVMPDRISRSTSLEHVECYVIMCKITLQNFKIKQFVQPQY